MGIIGRQGFQNFIFNYLGVIIGFVNKSLLFPVFLAREEVGMIELLLAGMVIGSEVSQFGINKIIVRFFPYYHKHPDREERFIGFVLSFSLFSFLCTTGIFFAIYPFLYDGFSVNAPLFAERLYLIPVLIFAYLSYRVFMGLSQGLLKSVVPLFAQQVLLRFVIALILVLYGLDLFTLDVLVWSYVLVHFVPPLVTLVYILWLGKVKLTLNLALWGTRGFKIMMVFGLFASMSDAILIIINKLDLTMLAGMVGEDKAGVYSNAFYLALMILIPFRSLVPILNPMIALKAKERKYAEIESLYQKSAMNNLILGGLILLLIWTNLDNYYLLTPKLALFQDGYHSVEILTLGLLVSAILGVQRAILVFSRHYRFDLYSNLITLVIVAIGNYFLIPVLYETGAAIGTAIGLFAYNLMGTIYVYSKMGVRPVHLKMLPVIPVLAGLYLLIQLIPQQSNIYVDVGMRTTIAIGIYAPSIYYMKVSEDFNQIVRKILKMSGFG